MGRTFGIENLSVLLIAIFRMQEYSSSIFYEVNRLIILKPVRPEIDEHFDMKFSFKKTKKQFKGAKDLPLGILEPTHHDIFPRDYPIADYLERM